MDKGVKKFQKNIKKVEKFNNKIIQNAVNTTLSLKRQKLSDISCRTIYNRPIILHKDTNNFPILKQKVLNKIHEIHELYPYIQIYYDNRTIPCKNKKTTYSYGNRLVLSFNYEDYMKYISSTMEDTTTNSYNLPNLGIEKIFNNINTQNTQIIQNSLNQILSTVNQHTTDDITDTYVTLAKNTMLYEITRNHCKSLSQQIMRKYNGVVEIFYTNVSSITIRIHWNIYLAHIASITNRNKQVPLLIDNTNTKSSFIYPPSINLPSYDKVNDAKQFTPKKSRIRRKKTSSSLLNIKEDDYLDFPDTPSEIPVYEKPLYPPMAEYS